MEVDRPMSPRARSPRRRSPSPMDRRRSPSPRRQRRSPRRSPVRAHRISHAEKEAPQPSHVLGVFGLSLRTTERDLDEIFAQYGKVEKVTVVYDAYTRKSRGFAFVTFASVEDASKARESTNGIEIDDRRIRVDFSVTLEPHKSTPGVYMGRPSRRSRYNRSPPRRRYRSRSRSRSRDRDYRRRSPDRRRYERSRSRGRYERSRSR